MMLCFPELRFHEIGEALKTVMESLGLSFDELQQVLQQCHDVRVSCYPPGFDLKAFLMGLFRERSPATAARIERLSDKQLRSLCQEIIDHQKWAS
jgi:hypothetical protein